MLRLPVMALARAFGWCFALIAVVAPAECLAQATRAALPSGPSPLALRVEPVAGTWRLRWTIVNTSDAPIEVAADRRLLWLEAPIAPTTTRRRLAPPPRCVHADRPRAPDLAARTRLAPGERYSELVDLRDTCNLRLPSTVSAGATLTAHYGFDPPAGPRVTLARWRARTLVFDARTYPVNDLQATVAAPTPGDDDARGAPQGGLAVVARDAQASTGDGLRVGVTLRNESGHVLWTLLRTTQFGFDLETPSGRAMRCDLLARESNPFRDLFVRLGPGARRAQRLVLADYCPTGTFDEAGIYRARAWFESRADGEPWLHGQVFTGRSVSAPVVLRVARGRGRYVPFGLVRGTGG